MDEIYEKTLLYDYYGELLTKRQREIYEDVVFNDMSLSEAAEAYGISRQGIHDMIRRCNEALQELEQKLHMVEQCQTIRKAAEEILEKAEAGEKTVSPDREKQERELTEVRSLAESILKALQ
ncbi:MAG: DNA-binding protein [Lachnospiraceae bacterium]|nr:DNA-binding protein [Lachnospiraceae bacterium]